MSAAAARTDARTPPLRTFEAVKYSVTLKECDLKTRPSNPRNCVGTSCACGHMLAPGQAVQYGAAC